MLTRRISTRPYPFLYLFLFVCLSALAIDTSGGRLLAQKNCLNSVNGEIYLDANNNGIYEPDEDKIPGPVVIVAQTTRKEWVYPASDGTFETDKIACGIYTVKYNEVTIGTFEIAEVVGGVRIPFPVTPEIIAGDTSTEPSQPTEPSQTVEPVPLPYQIYLPLVNR